MAMAVTTVVLIGALATSLLFLRPRTATFTYAPNTDQNWSNPTNWDPAYPGTKIPEGEAVVLYGPTQLHFEELQVEGELTIEREGNLSGPNTRIRVLPGGIIRNRGELQAKEITVEGAFENAFGASLSTSRLSTTDQSITLIQPSASVRVEGELRNQGTFRNFGQIWADSLSDPQGRLSLNGSGKLKAGRQARK
jgi:hypothetical protein